MYRPSSKGTSWTYRRITATVSPGGTFATDCVNRFGRSCSVSAAVLPSFFAASYVRFASSRRFTSDMTTRFPIRNIMSVTAAFGGSGNAYTASSRSGDGFT